MQFDMLRGYEDAVGKMCQLLQELLAGSESDAGVWAGAPQQWAARCRHAAGVTAPHAAV